MTYTCVKSAGAYTNFQCSYLRIVGSGFPLDPLQLQSLKQEKVILIIVVMQSREGPTQYVRFLDGSSGAPLPSLEQTTTLHNGSAEDPIRRLARSTDSTDYAHVLFATRNGQIFLSQSRSLSQSWPTCVQKGLATRMLTWEHVEWLCAPIARRVEGK